MSPYSRYFHTALNFIWDFTCAVSLIGIWPRFVEPNWLQVTRQKISINNLPKDLEGLTILQLSDLHLKFSKKLVQTIRDLRPDLIVFTGDFLCYGQLLEKEKLQKFLNSFSAPYGCYAILGNHDYAAAVSFNEAGDYDVLEKRPSALLKGLKRLFTDIIPTGNVTEKAKAVPFNQHLIDVLKQSPFKLLHNETVQIAINASAINITGLGEYMLGRCQPSIAFQKYDDAFPGIILSHNPDSLPLLKEFPGDLILSGHTHGGQVNLPWIWKRYTLMENRTYAKGGLYSLNSKQLYVSRGLGSVLPFRFMATPELVYLTLEAS